jgi:hypothetical protein
MPVCATPPGTSGILPGESIPGRIFAAPSWVIPGTLAENCVFLAGKVNEAGLLFFETTASLAYGAEDLPPFLADLPLSYHAHLPVDLEWEEPEKAAVVCADLLDKISFLGQKGGQQEFSSPRAVLHPPAHDPADALRAARLLERFAAAFTARGHSLSSLLLENVRGNDLSGLRGLVRELGFGVCLDTGHALAYGQGSLLRDAALLERVALVHVNAPGRGAKAGGHFPLPSLDAAGQALCASFCRAAPEEAVIMLELFRWEEILLSLPLVRAWLLP